MFLWRKIHPSSLSWIYLQNFKSQHLRKAMCKSAKSSSTSVWFVSQMIFSASVDGSLWAVSICIGVITVGNTVLCARLPPLIAMRKRLVLAGLHIPWVSFRWQERRLTRYNCISGDTGLCSQIFLYIVVLVVRRRFAPHPLKFHCKVTVVPKELD